MDSTTDSSSDAGGPATAGTTDDGLRAWLIGRVAFYLDQPPESIDPSVELAVYGMDSIYALSVISDIEDRLLTELDASEVREHRTVNALVDYLRKLPAGSPGPARPAGSRDG